VSARFREIGTDRLEEFVARGYKQRQFFPHRVYHLPKCGPDGFRIAGWMCDVNEPSAMWELVLYADDRVLSEFPRELFFDDDVIWHQQQFGRPGQVASASVVLDGDTVDSITHVSDLVQRISRRREHKTRVEKVFSGWNQMLINAVLNFAAENGARRVRFPTLPLAVRHTDRSRQTDYTIFERIYDRTLNSLFQPQLEGEWWVLELDAVRERIVVPEIRSEPPAGGGEASRTIAICHDLERGLGHIGIDDALARRAEGTSPRDLVAMREIEAELGVRCTYCVVGALMDEVRDDLERDGHCVAFHSFDHRLEHEQLLRCREVDYRIKGYRPPGSRITPELTDRSLLFHNFEWLASSPGSLGADQPVLRSGLVRLPIMLDDFALHTGAMSYEEWERTAMAAAAADGFAAISLHDCYAPAWLPHYRRFLERIRELGELRTLNEVAAQVTLASSR
jgi:hypothetical protein